MTSRSACDIAATRVSPRVQNPLESRISQRKRRKIDCREELQKVIASSHASGSIVVYAIQRAIERVEKKRLDVVYYICSLSNFSVNQLQNEILEMIYSHSVVVNCANNNLS